MTVLGLIPARGGSKGIPKKNLRDLCGKPLIAWTIESALKSTKIDNVVVHVTSRSRRPNQFLVIDDRRCYTIFAAYGITYTICSWTMTEFSQSSA